MTKGCAHPACPLPVGPGDYCGECGAYVCPAHNGVRPYRADHEPPAHWQPRPLGRLCPGCRSLDGEHDFGSTCTLPASSRDCR